MIKKSSNFTVPVIPGYRISEMIAESTHAAVFKGFRVKNKDKSLILKVFHGFNLSDIQISHIRQRIERLKVIHNSHIIIPQSFETYENIQFIVQDYYAGISIGEWTESIGRIPLNDFFPIACTLANVLGVIHSAGVIHGGIKPKNILIQPDTLDIRLIDFITPLDIQEISHFIYEKQFIKNTLSYTSPEQTGRINHRVMFSTDMYSLAITFYEMLTGEVPYSSADPLALIHSHLAERPPLLQEVNSEIPEAIGNIVSKLFLKEPEKRYQSGHGLYADLMTARQKYEKTGWVKSFPLGIYDHISRVIFISRMVGRDDESKLILDEYNTVTVGAFRSVFISGLPGIGKTRLIQELQRPLVEKRGYFTSGKFDQYQKNIPYSSLIQALRNLMRTFLTESNEQIALWRDKILHAVDKEGQLVIEVVPELEKIIGVQPEVPSLPPVEARNRFNNLFSRFITCLANEENPLILFIDDLQWCDAATFDFLSNIFASPEEHPYLFLLGAYRHNEVDNSHPLTKLISSIKGRKQPLKEVRLQPLMKKDCHEMVSYILDAPLSQTETLSYFLANLTEGNPLFVSESLSYLNGEDLLYISKSGHSNEWQWDLEKIQDTEMPETVVDLFINKVKQFSDETIEILVNCACLGNSFAPDEIALILKISLQELFQHLNPVLSLGLIIESKSNLQFVHDRVQEAVLRLSTPGKRQQIHWRIGTRLLSTLADDAALAESDSLFTIAAHINLGKGEKLDSKQAYLLSDINYYAGNKALDALATDAANEYFRESIKTLPGDYWKDHYERTFKIYQKLAKTELMCGRFEESEKLINQLIDNAKNDLDKTEALAEQTTSLSSIGNFNEAIVTANRGLQYFDKAIPEDSDVANERMNDLMDEIHSENDDVWDKILNMQFTEDRKNKIELSFYSELIPDLYMSGLVPQLYLSAAQSTQHCLAGGMDESVIYSFSIMGLNLGEQGKFEEAYRYEDLAHELCAEYPNTFGATRGMNGIVWCNMHSRSHPAEIIDYCYKSIQCGKNCGDLYNAGLSYGPLMWHMQVKGENLKITEDAVNECLQFSQKNGLFFSIGLAEAMEAGWIKPMKQGYSPVPMDEKLKTWKQDNHVASAGCYFVHMGLSHYYLGEYEIAQDMLNNVTQYLKGLTDNILKRQWYVFRVLNEIRLFKINKGADSKEALMSQIGSDLKMIRTWSELGPVLKPYMGFVDAELASIDGDFRQVRSLYQDAIDVANDHGYIFLQAHINECLARIIMDAGKGTEHTYIYEAARLYNDCDAERKRVALMERFSDYFADREMLVNIKGNGKSEDSIFSNGSLQLPNLDVDYLMKSSLALSAEIEKDKLLHRIINVVLESSGAQFGYLLVREKGNLMVNAESHVNQKTFAYLEPHKFEDVENLCKAIIRYVNNTGEIVVLDNASKEGDFSKNAEVQSLGLCSVLCLPVYNQSEQLGVLYLENRLAEGMFTPDKVRITTLLTSHAAISLENSRLMDDMRRVESEIRDLNRDLELRVDERTAELQASNQELESFSYSISHDLRAPLRSINGFSELLLEKYKENLSPDAQDYLERIENASVHMGDLIDDLLKLSRVTRSEMHRMKIDLSNMANKILEDLQEADPERKVRIDVKKGVSASADTGTIRVALQNLLANAWKFTSKKQKAKIEFGSMNQDGKNIFYVRDNGAGFDPQYQDKLFLPFQRLHSAKLFEGNGIGLAIVKRVIDRHGGKIWAETNDGKGATFYFSLIEA